MKLPEQFISRMKERGDIDIESFLNSYNTPAQSGIRINPNKDNGMLFEAAFGAVEKVPWCSNGYYVNKDDIKGTHPYHMAGMFYFQEPSAMCSAALLPLDDGDFVLDLCAAPGGKSTQVAANSKIILVSNEIIPKRCNILSENIERMGFSNVVVTNESPERLEEKFPSFFDKIIIDAPCSGEGMFKKEPAAVDAWSVEHVISCAARQKKIIDSAMKMLAVGGGIVYSTCTFSKEENEDNVDYITKNYPYMKVGKIERLYPHIQKGEGHFAAYIYDSREKCNERLNKDKTKRPDEQINMFREFEKSNLNTNLNGEFVLFGENLYLKPMGVSIDGIKTPRPGLHLGVCKKGRFEPAHALAKALTVSDFKKSVNYNYTDAEITKYLKGETICSDVEGYCVVACNSLPLGWAKGSNGVLKNKLPKGLRIF